MKDKVKQVNESNTEVALAENLPEDKPEAEETSVEENTVETKAVVPKAQTKESTITYYENAKVTCSCGTTFTVGSTKSEIRVEVCSKCHPFYTGQAKFVDTEGRVEAFQRRVSAKKEPKEKKAEAPTKPERPKSLKEMLELIQAGQ